MKQTYKVRQGFALPVDLNFEADCVSVLNPTPYTLLIRTGNTAPPSNIEVADLFVAPASGATYPVSGRSFGLILALPQLAEIPGGMPNVAQVIFQVGETPPTMGGFALTQAVVTIANPVSTVTVANPVTSVAVSNPVTQVGINGTVPVSGTVGVSGTVPVSGGVTTTPAAGTTQAVSGSVGVTGNIPVTNAPSTILDTVGRLPAEIAGGFVSGTRVVGSYSDVFAPNDPTIRAVTIARIGGAISFMRVYGKNDAMLVMETEPNKQRTMYTYHFPFYAVANPLGFQVETNVSTGGPDTNTSYTVYYHRQYSPGQFLQGGAHAVQELVRYVDPLWSLYNTFRAASSGTSQVWQVDCNEQRYRYFIQGVSFGVPQTTAAAQCLVDVWLYRSSDSAQVVQLVGVNSLTTVPQQCVQCIGMEIPSGHFVRCFTKNTDTVAREIKAGILISRVTR